MPQALGCVFCWFYFCFVLSYSFIHFSIPSNTFSILKNTTSSSNRRNFIPISSNSFQTVLKSKNMSMIVYKRIFIKWNCCYNILLQIQTFPVCYQVILTQTPSFLGMAFALLLLGNLFFHLLVMMFYFSFYFIKTNFLIEVKAPAVSL